MIYHNKELKVHSYFKRGASAFVNSYLTNFIINLVIGNILIIILGIGLFFKIKYSIHISFFILWGLFILMILLISFIFFYKYIKYKKIFRSYLKHFIFDDTDYFFDKEYSENRDANIKLCIDFSVNKKFGVMLNYSKMNYLTLIKKIQIYLFYFIIWGHHFIEVNQGNEIWEDLYQEFVNQKNKGAW
ncbi:hypothetical protein [Mycoplasmopsis mustelae]|uniref:hypothetical protein n=1 Tax=Mycoplasmopsis mustelae TaxID=171289 RepID=UPI001416F8CE|nr:hypothetical protein [Mycoplasmopsis mustelae]